MERKLKNPITNRFVTPSAKHAKAIASALPRSDIPIEWHSIIDEYESKTASRKPRSKSTIMKTEKQVITLPKTLEELLKRTGKWTKTDCNDMGIRLRDISASVLDKHKDLMGEVFETCKDPDVYKNIFSSDNKALVDALKKSAHKTSAIMLLAQNPNPIEKLDAVLEAQSRFNDFSAWNDPYYATTPFMVLLTKGDITIDHCHLFTKYLNTPKLLSNFAGKRFLNTLLHIENLLNSGLWFEKIHPKNIKYVKFFMNKLDQSAIQDEVKALLKFDEAVNPFHYIKTVSQFEMLKDALGEELTTRCLNQRNDRDITPLETYLYTRNEKLTIYTAENYKNYFWNTLSNHVGYSNRYQGTLFVEMFRNGDTSFYKLLHKLCKRYGKQDLFVKLLTTDISKPYPGLSPMSDIFSRFDSQKQRNIEFLSEMIYMLKKDKLLNIHLLAPCLKVYCKFDNPSDVYNLAGIIYVILQHTDIPLQNIMNIIACIGKDAELRNALNIVTKKQQQEEKKQQQKEVAAFENRSIPILQKLSKHPGMTDDMIHQILMQSVGRKIKQIVTPDRLNAFIAKFNTINAKKHNTTSKGSAKSKS